MTVGRGDFLDVRSSRPAEPPSRPLADKCGSRSFPQKPSFRCSQRVPCRLWPAGCCFAVLCALCAAQERQLVQLTPASHRQCGGKRASRSSSSSVVSVWVLRRKQVPSRILRHRTAPHHILCLWRESSRAAIKWQSISALAGAFAVRSGHGISWPHASRKCASPTAPRHALVWGQPDAGGTRKGGRAARRGTARRGAGAGAGAGEPACGHKHPLCLALAVSVALDGSVRRPLPSTRRATADGARE